MHTRNYDGDFFRGFSRERKKVDVATPTRRRIEKFEGDGDDGDSVVAASALLIILLAMDK